MAHLQPSKQQLLKVIQNATSAIKSALLNRFSRFGVFAQGAIKAVAIVTISALVAVNAVAGFSADVDFTSPSFTENFESQNTGTDSPSNIMGAPSLLPPPFLQPKPESNLLFMFPALAQVITSACAESGNPCVDNDYQGVKRQFVCRNCSGRFHAFVYYGNTDTINRRGAGSIGVTFGSSGTTFTMNPATWNKIYPMITAYHFIGSSFSDRSYVENAIRVLGITGGTIGITVATAANTWEADFSGVMNVLTAAVHSSEMNYQWQRGTSETNTDSGWQNIPSQTTDSYTLIDSDFTGQHYLVRLIASDLAPTSPLDSFAGTMKITSNALAVKVAPEPDCTDGSGACVDNNFENIKRRFTCRNCTGSAQAFVYFGTPAAIAARTANGVGETVASGTAFTMDPVTWNKSFPMVTGYETISGTRTYVRNAIRVLGITGGTVGITAATAADTWAADISDVANVLNAVVHSSEMTYQWQRATIATSTDASWEDIPTKTADSYTKVDSDFPGIFRFVRLIATDLAPESTLDSFVTGTKITSNVIEAVISTVRIDLDCASVSIPCIGSVDTNPRQFTCTNCVGYNIFVYAGNAAAIAKHDAVDTTLLRAIDQTDNVKTYDMNPANWDKQYPMLGGFIDGGVYVTNVIRVLGITGGTMGITVATAANTWAADISDVANVLTADVHSSEMTYQWQRGTIATSTDASWENIDTRTADSYTLIDSDFTGQYYFARLIATDIAPESTLDSFVTGTKITSNALAVKAAPVPIFSCTDGGVACVYNNHQNVKRRFFCRNCGGADENSRWVYFGTPAAIAARTASEIGVAALNEANFTFNMDPATWDKSYPMVTGYRTVSGTRTYVANEIRVLGITGGTMGITVGAAANTWEADTSDVSNVLTAVVHSSEMTYQWQRATIETSTDASWENIPSRTADSYTRVDSDFTGLFRFARLIATDLAPESTLDSFVTGRKITSNAIEAVTAAVLVSLDCASVAIPCIGSVDTNPRQFTCTNCANPLYNVFVYAGNAAAITKHNANDGTLLRAIDQTDQAKTYDMNPANWDKQYPMLGGFISGGVYVTNVIRVLGITGGTLGITAVAAGGAWEADISDVSNVLTADVHSSEMTYKWQRGTSATRTDTNWQDIPSRTADSYTLIDSDFTGRYRFARLIASDLAPTSPLDSFAGTMKITSNALAVKAAQAPDPAPTGELAIEEDGFAPGNTLTINITDTSPNSNFVRCVNWQAGNGVDSWNPLKEKGDCVGGEAVSNLSTYILTLDINGPDATGGEWDPTWTLVRALVIYGNSDSSQSITLVAALNIKQNFANATPTAFMALPVTTGSLVGSVIVLSVANFAPKDRNADNPGSFIFKALGTPPIAAVADADLTANTLVVTNTISASDDTAFQNIVTHYRAGNRLEMQVLYISPFGFTSTLSGEYLPLSVNIALNGVILTATPLGLTFPLASDYQWVKSATETGTYSAISGATERTYSVPIGVDASRVWVRMTTTGSGISSPIKVGGVREGGAPIINFASSDNRRVNSLVTLDLGSMRSRLGRSVSEAFFDFQWQVVSESGVTTNIATGVNYRLVAADFSNTKMSLQVILTDKTDSSNTFIAVARNVNSRSLGRVGLGYNADTSTHVVGTGGVTDNNGIGTFTYQWYSASSSAATEISGATMRFYTSVPANFAGGASVVVSVSHTDPFGFITDLMIGDNTPLGDPPSADLAISPACATCYAAGQEFSATLSNINEDGGTAFRTFSWLRGKSSESGTFIAAPGSSNGSTYALNESFGSGGYDVLLVSVELSNRNGSATLMTQININRPTRGEPTLIPATEAIGNIISVDIAPLRDDNNGAEGAGGRGDNYIWTRVAGGVTVTLRTSSAPTYTIDDRYLQAEGAVQVVFNYLDDLGYVTPFTVDAPAGATEKYIENVASILNVIAAAEAADAVDAHLQRTSKYDPDSVTWQWSRDLPESNNSARFWLNGVEVSGSEDLTRALASRTDDSTHTARTGALGGFAIDSAAAEIPFEDSSNRRWTAWSNLGWHAVDGDVNVNARNITYRGTGFGIYTGADVWFNENWRTGAVYARTNTKIKSALHEDNIKNDTISREMDAILPYVEYVSGKMNTRVIIGVGLGGADINEIGEQNCHADVDMEWTMLSASSTYEALTSNDWNMDMYAGYNYSNNTLKEAQCEAGGQKFAEIDSESSEAKFGVQLAYESNANFRPYFGLQSRSVFGDIDDDVAYDAAYGVRWQVIGYYLGVWSLEADGKTQINQSKFQRDNLSGSLSYQVGEKSYSASSAIEADENGNGITHRIEWNQKWNQSLAWGINTINSGIYVQRRDSDKPTDSLGAKVQLNF